MIRTIASLTRAPDFIPKSMFEGQQRETKQSLKTIRDPTISSPHDTELPHGDKYESQVSIPHPHASLGNPESSFGEATMRQLAGRKNFLGI